MSVLPNMKTTIDRCEHKSLYTCAMLRNYSDVKALDGLADKLADATTTLLGKQAAYQQKVKALVLVRVEIKFSDKLSDQAIRLAMKRAEIEDGRPGGKIAMALFPNGSTPIIKPVGGTQIKEMRALEGRFAEVGAFYTAAGAESAKIKTHRERYESALEARAKGLEIAAQARAARELAKEEFLDVFAEAVNRIRAAFPRDKQSQDLFFLKDKEAAEVGDDSDTHDPPDTAEDGMSDHG